MLGAGEGSSGILFITPARKRNLTQQKSSDTIDPSLNLPKGIVVVILCNLHGVKFQKLANTIVQHTYSSSCIGFL